MATGTQIYTLSSLINTNSAKVICSRYQVREIQPLLSLKKSIKDALEFEFVEKMHSKIQRQLTKKQLPAKLINGFYNNLKIETDNCLSNHWINNVRRKLNIPWFEKLDCICWEDIEPELWISYSSWYDFCINVLGCSNYDSKTWEVLQLIVQECGWMFVSENICIVCERPIQINYDQQRRLHAEGETAVKFADEFSIYAYHGVILPEKYGRLHPCEWQARWLEKEDDFNLRAVLSQGIGYNRICQELQATELDSWFEHTLLKVESKQIHLLITANPNTDVIYVSRVPAEIRSVKEALTRINI